MSVDALAGGVQRRVYNRVLADPGRSRATVGRQVASVRGRAVAAGQASMEPRRTAGRRLLERLTGAGPVPRFTVAEQDERSLLRRAAASPGAVFVDGRWMRPRRERFRVDGRPIRSRGPALVRIPTTMDLVQSRVREAEKRAMATAKLTARRLGVKEPNGRKRGPFKDADQRVVEAYRRRLALECGRIAHDAVMDDYRDAAFDRADQLGVGWKRECERNACGACLALADGVVHPPGARLFYRHTRCRCRPVPATRRVRTGREIFDGLTRDEQDRLFHGRGGEVKAELLRTGRVDLPDMVLIASERLESTEYVVSEAPLEGLLRDATT